METKRTVSQEIEDKIKYLITYIGDNPNREGLIDTPKRILKSWDKIFSGYKQNGEDILKTNFIEGTCKELVILKDVEFYSTCEHHFLPFFGKISVGYIPKNKVVGISKLARLIEVYARRLQIQERLTTQIADDIVKYLNAESVIVIVEAQHFCMTSRGVEKQQSKMVTSAIRGLFEKVELRNEFLQLIKG
jgi:GTP cyclohydrolase I